MAINFGPGTFPYIIQVDDTVWDLAERYDTTAEEIMNANPGVDLNNLFVGQVIAVLGDPPSLRGPEFERRRRVELERKRREELERRRKAEAERRRQEELERRRRAEAERKRREELERRHRGKI